MTPEHRALRMDGESKCSCVLRTLSEQDKDQIKKRILSNVHPSEKGCWNWTGPKNDKGYGYFSVKGTLVSAHRVSFVSFKGPLGQLFACHHCDNPNCVNPDHLFAGTKSDNSQDMLRKGRGKKPKLPSHCKRGHEFTPENTILPKGRVSRECKKCRIELRKASKVLSEMSSLHI